VTIFFCASLEHKINNMKKIIAISLSILLLTACAGHAQKPSPAATVTQKIGDATVTINYSQPSVKGRTIGVNLEPMAGKVWRTGANDATVFETDKDITVEGKALPAGKYALFTLVDGKEWTIIFNKTWKQWGAFKYSQADDALRVTVKAEEAKPFAETMTFTISEKGKVALWWGDSMVEFKVK
jgi:PBP1b-binding outer membrane lipoprotein LpoB